MASEVIIANSFGVYILNSLADRERKKARKKERKQARKKAIAKINNIMIINKQIVKFKE